MNQAGGKIDSESFFAPAPRASESTFHRDVAFVAGNPIIDALLALASGVLAVVNEERQVVAVNRSFLEFLGIDDAGALLGLRPGEVVGCVNANAPPHGCGTTEVCATCGAAIAIVTSMQTDSGQERMCVMTVEREGRREDRCFRVRASPMRAGQRKYAVLFLHDITDEERLAAMHRVFLHDINNQLGALLGASELLAADGVGDRDLLDTVATAARHIRGAIAAHRSVMHNGDRSRPPALQTVDLPAVLDEVVRVYSAHPAGAGKTIVASSQDTVPSIRTDPALLMRVLGNMVVNALEATIEGGVVRIACEVTPKHLAFSVHNTTVIPSELALRVFQPHFSTRPGPGRGLGTHSMKLIGEQLLGGKIEFTSAEPDGTTFRFLHPW